MTGAVPARAASGDVPAPTLGLTVLVVEDEPSIGQLLRGYLQRDGYRVVWVRTGEEALVELSRHDVRIVVLDIGLPGMDGFDVCRRIRARSSVPIVMLTARDEEPDRVAGLELGADDYVPKPFPPRELTARIKAILRRLGRASAPQAEVIHIGPCEINLKKHTLTRARKTTMLTFYEVELLKLLHERAEQPVSRDEILDKIWGIEAYPSNRTVDNFVVKLRKKLEENQHHPRHILTVYGYGYKLVP